MMNKAITTPKGTSAKKMNIPPPLKSPRKDSITKPITVVKNKTPKVGEKEESKPSPEEATSQAEHSPSHHFFQNISQLDESLLISKIGMDPTSDLTLINMFHDEGLNSVMTSPVRNLSF